MVAAQGDVVAENIGRSLAEAKAVSEQLEQNVPGDLARTVLDGAQQAFLHPSSQAYIVLGALVIAGSAVLAF